MTTSSNAEVLIVEDDPALSDAFKIVLTFAGYQATNTYNGQEALDYLKTNKPDIIILDILMPVMDGRDFLRNFDNKDNIPIIALSNLDAKSEIEQIIKLGATKYTLKSSASSSELVTLVKQTLTETKKDQ